MLIKNVVICDDIRREDNGKNMLIGVYSGSIIVSGFPANLSLAAWIRFELAGVTPAKVDCRLLGNDDAVLGNIDQMTIQPGPSSLALCGITAQLKESGSLTLQFRQEGGEWETAEAAQVVAQISA